MWNVDTRRKIDVLGFTQPRYVVLCCDDSGSVKSQNTIVLAHFRTLLMSEHSEGLSWSIGYYCSKFCDFVL
jgi:hypothetical protein